MRSKFNNLVLFIGIIVVTCWVSLFAATWYVSFTDGADTNNGTSSSTPLKHIKGMTGCANNCSSMTLVGGDTVIFKGSDTWTSSFPWAIVSGSSSAITYTVDTGWFRGGAFVTPIFDDQARGTSYGSDATVTGSGVWITLNGLKFYRCGPLNASSNQACFLFDSPHDLSVTNSVFDSGTWFTFYLRYDGSAGTFSNITFDRNEWTRTSAAMWVGYNRTNVITSNFTIKNSTMHDAAPLLGDGLHGDGFIHYFNVKDDTTSYMTGFHFFNNKTYGDFSRSLAGSNEDMTGFVFLEGPVKFYEIYNNDFGFTPFTNASGLSNIFDGLIQFKNSITSVMGTGYVVNNTFHGTAAVGGDSGSAAIEGNETFGGLTLKNNAIEFSDSCYYTPSSVTSSFSDYNNKHCQTPDVSGWPTEGAHSINTSNGFVSTTDSHLQSGSANRGAGQDLTSLGITGLNTDRDGAARPSGSAWDIGAYQFDPTPPPAGNALPTIMKKKFK